MLVTSEINRSVERHHKYSDLSSVKETDILTAVLSALLLRWCMYEQNSIMNLILNKCTSLGL